MLGLIAVAFVLPSRSGAYISPSCSAGGSSSDTWCLLPC